MLYVLDEPSIGLHPRDINQLLGAIRQLRDRGNTVVVVEHEEAIIRAADQVDRNRARGGRARREDRFSGHARRNGAIARQPHRRLSGRPPRLRQQRRSAARRTTAGSVWPARGNNLKNITVEFPLGVLCLVTGVSGSGKSTLVQDTLYPALCRRLRKDAPKPYPHRRRLRRRPARRRDHGRSEPHRPLAALQSGDLLEGVRRDPRRVRRHGRGPHAANYDAGHFSFNVDGGRCNACQGDGYIQIDMQFLADVYMRAPSATAPATATRSSK